MQLHRAKAVASPKCSHCAVPDSAEHRIFQCPGHSAERRTLQNELIRLTEDGTLNRKRLLALHDVDQRDHKKAADSIKQFLTSTGLHNLFVFNKSSMPVPATSQEETGLTT
jgi:hypothetical protein